ncbi:MAG: ABC transporter substrate-binding protein [Deltaproteobacteria bacterium]|nr:ABC transporter substrate-binding protein [Deltaproteobacteria bacterium]
MDRQRTDGWSRREFLGGLVLAGAAGLLGLKPESLAVEPPPETTTIRLAHFGATCTAPQHVAEDFLKAEGFTEVQYVKTQLASRTHDSLALGELDIDIRTIGLLTTWVDSGDPIVILGGVHTGCYELFGTGQVRTIRDLKGKTVAVPVQGGAHQIFLSSMLAYIGLNPGKDIKWVTHPWADTMRLLAEGKIDAYLGFPPEPQELREKQIGHVVVNTTLDRPWSQYFCCMVAGNREFVRQHPVATKRALRAILKAIDVCALQPEHAAHVVVDKGFTQRYDYALQVMKDIPYGKWAEYNPEDTVRFYALRLREAEIIKSSPQNIITEGTDWRFLNEL